MEELANCSRCNTVFVKNMREICHNCFREEEEAFEMVYRFLSKRANREATIFEIVEATEVEEELIIKFIREKRLRTSQFPKLAYPCERCDVQIISGRLCQSCSETILHDFAQQARLDEREKEKHDKRKQRANTYFSIERRRS